MGNRTAIAANVARGRGQRQAPWSAALAVGDPEQLDGLFPGGHSPRITLTPAEVRPTVAEHSPTYALQAPKREQHEAWRTSNR